MKNKYKYQFIMYSISDIRILEQHYSEMAEKGWMIDKIGFIMRYRKIEPCKKHFFVDLLPQITSYDYPDNEDAQDYRLICEESGWNFVTAKRQIHVFCADGDNNTPVPIHTDNKIIADIYLKESRKNILGYLLIPLPLLSTILLSTFTSGIESLFFNSYLFQFIGNFCLLPGYIWNFVHSINWHIKTKKSSKNNLPMPYVNRRLSKYRNRLFSAGALAYAICLIYGIFSEFMNILPFTYIILFFTPILPIYIGLLLRRRIEKKPRSRKNNKITTLIFIIVFVVIYTPVMTNLIFKAVSDFESHNLGDRPALKLAYFGINEEPTYSDTFIRESIVVPLNYNYAEIYNRVLVETHVYRSISKKLSNRLYEHFADKMIDRYINNSFYSYYTVVALTDKEAAYWGAEKGIALDYKDNKTNNIILLKDKTILNLRLPYFTDADYNFDIDYDLIIQAVHNLWSELE